MDGVSWGNGHHGGAMDFKPCPEIFRHQANRHGCLSGSSTTKPSGVCRQASSAGLPSRLTAETGPAPSASERTTAFPSCGQAISQA